MANEGSPLHRDPAAGGRFAAARRAPLTWVVVAASALVALVVVGGGARIAVIAVAAVLAVAGIRYWLPVLVACVVFEMALGGYGHLASVAGLSVRQALLVAVLGAWAARRLLITRGPTGVGPVSGALLVFFGVCLVTLLVSVARGNPLAFQDGATSAFALLALPLCECARTESGRERLLRWFLWAVFALALLQIVLIVAFTLRLLPAHQLARSFNQAMGGITLTPEFVRVFIVGSIFFQVGVLLLVSAQLAGTSLVGRWSDRVILAASAVGLVLTYTRGFWIATLLGLVVLFPLTTARGRVRAVAVVAVVLVVAAVTLAVSGAAFTGPVFDRVASLFSDRHDVSVAYRLTLYPRLLARIADRPLFGYGFGYPLEGGIYYENSYFYYLIKFGVAGLLALAIAWALFLVRATVQPTGPVAPRWRAASAGLASAALSLLLVTAINPFINSPMGLFFQAWGAALLDATWFQAGSDAGAGATSGRSSS
jgi:O-antigen ligase